MDLTKTLMNRIGVAPEDLDVNSVLGSPESVGATTVVPVTEMLVGFGIGAGAGAACCDDDADECCGGDCSGGCGAGGGGHAVTRPIATIEVGPDGTHVHPIVDSQRVTLAAVLLSGWVFGWVALVLKVLFDQERS
jgi:uncharacterized spore protein YtfJ